MKLDKNCPACGCPSLTYMQKQKGMSHMCHKCGHKYTKNGNQILVTP